MKLYDHVKIKSSGITGVIVDIFGERFTVESDTERVPGDTRGYPGRWPLFTCPASELELRKYVEALRTTMRTHRGFFMPTRAA